MAKPKKKAKSKVAKRRKTGGATKKRSAHKRPARKRMKVKRARASAPRTTKPRKKSGKGRVCRKVKPRVSKTGKPVKGYLSCRKKAKAKPKKKFHYRKPSAKFVEKHPARKRIRVKARTKKHHVKGFTYSKKMPAGYVGPGRPVHVKPHMSWEDETMKRKRAKARRARRAREEAKMREAAKPKRRRRRAKAKAAEAPKRRRRRARASAAAPKRRRTIRRRRARAHAAAAPTRRRRGTRVRVKQRSGKKRTFYVSGKKRKGYKKVRIVRKTRGKVRKKTAYVGERRRRRSSKRRGHRRGYRRASRASHEFYANPIGGFAAEAGMFENPLQGPWEMAGAIAALTLGYMATDFLGRYWVTKDSDDPVKNATAILAPPDWKQMGIKGLAVVAPLGLSAVVHHPMGKSILQGAGLGAAANLAGQIIKTMILGKLLKNNVTAQNKLLPDVLAAEPPPAATGTQGLPVGVGMGPSTPPAATTYQQRPGMYMTQRTPGLPGGAPVQTGGGSDTPAFGGGVRTGGGSSLPPQPPAVYSGGGNVSTVTPVVQPPVMVAPPIYAQPPQVMTPSGPMAVSPAGGGALSPGCGPCTAESAHNNMVAAYQTAMNDMRSNGCIGGVDFSGVQRPSLFKD